MKEVDKIFVVSASDMKKFTESNELPISDEEEYFENIMTKIRYEASYGRCFVECFVSAYAENKLSALGYRIYYSESDETREFSTNFRKKAIFWKL